MPERVKKLIENMATNTPATPARMPFPKFTFGNAKGEDWISFKRRFDYYRAYHGATDRDAAFALRGCMVGAAGAAVESINMDDKSYSDLRNECDALFLPPAASALAQTRFEQVVQMKGEDVMNYHGRVNDLWQRAYPGAKNVDMLIRRFALGLANSNVRCRVLRGPTSTYSDALALAQSEVAVESTNKAIMGVVSQSTPMEIGHIGGEDAGPIPSDDAEGIAYVQGDG